jgi:hypothetical protein
MRPLKPGGALGQITHKSSKGTSLFDNMAETSRFVIQSVKRAQVLCVVCDEKIFAGDAEEVGQASPVCAG